MYNFGVQKIVALSSEILQVLKHFATKCFSFLIISGASWYCFLTLTSCFFLHTWGSLICTKSIQTLVHWFNVSGTHFAYTHLNDIILPLLKAQVGCWTSTRFLQYQGFLLSTGTLVKGLTIHELLVGLKVICWDKSQEAKQHTFQSQTGHRLEHTCFLH